MGETIDIEDALREAMAEAGISASAPPVPKSLGASIPHVIVTRTGGFESSLVQDQHYVDFDVYAAGLSEATGVAGAVCALVRSLPGTVIGGVPCYDASIDTLPYGNPDPDRGDLSRVTCKARILTRTAGNQSREPDKGGNHA